MPRINKTLDDIGPERFRPELDHEREAVANCKVREWTMNRG